MFLDYSINEVQNNNITNNTKERLSRNVFTARKVNKWTVDEDQELKRQVGIYGERSWSKIAKLFKGKSAAQILQRWRKILKPGLLKGHWSPEEDKKLRTWVELNGSKNWSKAAELIKGRTNKQCRERWNNRLKPGVKKGGWTPEEDDKILLYYGEFGRHWTEIAKMLPGRSENSIKNRFYSHIMKKSKPLTDQTTSFKYDDVSRLIRTDEPSLELTDCQSPQVTCMEEKNKKVQLCENFLHETESLVMTSRNWVYKLEAHRRSNFELNYILKHMANIENIIQEAKLHIQKSIKEEEEKTSRSTESINKHSEVIENDVIRGIQREDSSLEYLSENPSYEDSLVFSGYDRGYTAN